MTNWKFVIGMGICGVIILIVRSLIDTGFLYPLITNNPGSYSVNYFAPIVFGFALSWGYQYSYNKLRGSNSIRKGIIMSFEVWIIFAVLSMILIALSFKDNFNIIYIISSYVLSTISFLCIGYLLGKAWDRLNTSALTQ